MAKAMSDPDAFNVNNLVTKFEACADDCKNTGDVDVNKYAECMREVRKVFDNLGSTFAFAFKDLDEKLTTLETHGPNIPKAGAMLENEKQRGSIPPSNDSLLDGKGGVSPVRALNRASHVCMFITGIFEELIASSSVTLTAACTQAYERTLAQIHGWIVKKSVKLAFNMVSDRKAFLSGCGVSDEDLSEKGQRFVKASAVITGCVKGHFEKRDLLWVF
ncbi:unnamed protein product [Amoebophrya sp. A25]|nr:unnamed protein product [Amoebophrya sp. A25]|eukprot:GSA25T00014243001.1